MEAESFFARWSKRKADTASDKSQAVPAEPAQPEEVLPPPTIEDVAALTPESDFTRFVARGVDEDIRRSAMKKLFADPHFNVMDGLDIYIDDYGKFEPIPPEMLAMLNHAKGLLDPLSQFERPLMSLLDNVAPPEAPADDPSAQAEPDMTASSADEAAESAADDALSELPTEHDDDNPIQSM